MNIEGGPDTKPLDTVDILSLDNEGQFGDASKWCSRPTENMPRALDASAVAWVDTWQYLDGQLGNARFALHIVNE